MLEDQNLPYRIEVWDDAALEIHETLARAAQLEVAQAAYKEALKQRPGRRVVLRRNGQVLVQSAE